jgi:hypothetical protein
MGTIESISSSLFRSSSSAGGVGLYLNNSVITTIAGCRFESLESSLGASAIHVSGSSSVGTIDKSVFNRVQGNGTIVVTDDAFIGTVSECVTSETGVCVCVCV